MLITDAKRNGAYYTPDEVAATLVRWVVRNESDKLIDPSCGDGQFLRHHAFTMGIEQDPSAFIQAAKHSRYRVQNADFFTWAAKTKARFDGAVGNPPFIRYQRFSGDIRNHALAQSKALGVNLNALAASWVPFLAVVSSLLKQGGRMGFVVPAEIGHAPYAMPLLEFFQKRFQKVQLVAIRDSVFPQLSQDVWLLYADGYGGTSQEIELTTWAKFKSTVTPPRVQSRVSSDLLYSSKAKLRSYLLDPEIMRIYERYSNHEATYRLGDVARVGIGYVTGANSFFHLRPSEAKAYKIPARYLMPTIRNGRSLSDFRVTEDTVKQWVIDDEPCFLLRLRKQDNLPVEVQRYLESAAGQLARSAYKCRNRTPWYEVPDVQIPDGFLTYMCGEQSKLVKNDAGCTCTNSLHSVRMKAGSNFKDIFDVWNHPLTQLSVEIEGHPLGGGMLKLEPREAAQVVLPTRNVKISKHEMALFEQGISKMREWRHYD